jgi:putative SOS response-associated peptidase YedK
MPGRFFLTAGAEALAALVPGGVAPDPLPEPRRNISPGEEILACTDSRSFRQMRWGIIPVGRKNARGRPVMETLINVRGETLFEKSAFEGFRRALVPASGWYEWTGAPRKKTAWRIMPRRGGPFLFAAVYDIWTAPGGREVPQVATVTCDPNAELGEIHHRMGVILSPAEASLWLDGDPVEARRLIRPLPDGSLRIEQADDVDWKAP